MEQQQAENAPACSVLVNTLTATEHQPSHLSLDKKADALWPLHGMKTSFSASVASLVDVDERSQVTADSSRS
jgi:hypothetical protein